MQGGGTTTLELTALGRPFLYFPLQGHFEQEVAVSERLARHRAGTKMRFSETTPGSLAETVVAHLGRGAAPRRSRRTELRWRRERPWRRCSPSCGLEAPTRMSSNTIRGTPDGVTPRVADGNTLPESPFVGRSPRVGQFTDALQRLARGQPGVVVVRGESGMGKSRLVREMMCSDAASALAWYTAKPDWMPPTGRTPYSPICWPARGESRASMRTRSRPP